MAEKTMLRKIRSLFEWLEYGKFAYEIGTFVGSVGLGKTLKAMLTTYTHLSPLWITPIWLLFTAAAIFTGLWLIRRMKGRQKPIATIVPTTPSTPSNIQTINLDQYFKKAYSSALEPEVDAHIRAMVAQNNGPSREETLFRLLVVSGVGYMYDVLFAYIYQSQLLLLQELNSKLILPVGEVRKFYDAAAQRHSTTYAKYTFDQWLNFLQSSDLVLYHPNGLVEGTNKCRDFLKYLVHWGKSINDKSL